MSIIKHVTLQKIVAHDFRYDPRMFIPHIHMMLDVYMFILCTLRFGIGVFPEFWSPQQFFRNSGLLFDNKWSEIFKSLLLHDVKINKVQDFMLR